MWVAKAVDYWVPLSTVTPLDADQQVDEIALMLSGEGITPAARDTARALLA
ncbi:MAG: hypothetical protein Q4G36_07495 [Paracoccus sp. (in: a-proteobacteria)]|nr:hypothetical protein [Paracoccus sp. (in: a-proteobacteria)]